MLKSIVRSIAAVVAAAMLSASLPGEALAASVDAAQLVEGAEAGAQRDAVRAALERDDVRAQLQALGVSVDEARARVDALTDEEIASLAGQLDRLPAGASDVIGVILFVFVLLLITDILGLTKVFPFTRSVR